MIPSEMRDAKARKITEAAQGLGWEALVEIKGYKFTVVLSAKGATEQMIEGKLSKALDLIDELGGPELYPATETYDLIPLGVHDAGKDLDEFVESEVIVARPRADDSPLTDEESEQLDEVIAGLGPRNQRDTVPPADHDDLEAMNEERPSGLDLSDEGIEATEAFIDGDDFEDPGEDAADALCLTCGNTGTQGVCPCGKVGECEIPAWVTELAASVPEPVEGEGWEVPEVKGLHEDSEFGDGRYTSPKETWAASQIDDQDRGGIPRPNQKEVEMPEGYVLTAARIVAEDGFVIVVRPQPTDQAEGFKIQWFKSINRSHAETLRDEYGYSIGIAALS